MLRHRAFLFSDTRKIERPLLSLKLGREDDFEKCKCDRGENTPSRGGPKLIKKGVFGPTKNAIARKARKRNR